MTRGSLRKPKPAFVTPVLRVLTLTCSPSPTLHLQGLAGHTPVSGHTGAPCYDKLSQETGMYAAQVKPHTRLCWGALPACGASGPGNGAILTTLHPLPPSPPSPSSHPEGAVTSCPEATLEGSNMAQEAALEQHVLPWPSHPTRLRSCPSPREAWQGRRQNLNAATPTHATHRG